MTLKVDSHLAANRNRPLSRGVGDSADDRVLRSFAALDKGRCQRWTPLFGQLGSGVKVDSMRFIRLPACILPVVSGHRCGSIAVVSRWVAGEACRQARWHVPIRVQRLGLKPIRAAGRNAVEGDIDPVTEWRTLRSNELLSAKGADLHIDIVALVFRDGIHLTVG